MFRPAAVEAVPAGDRERFFTAVERHARADLYRDGGWTADYRRLRVRATRPIVG